MFILLHNSCEQITANVIQSDFIMVVFIKIRVDYSDKKMYERKRVYERKHKQDVFS